MVDISYKVMITSGDSMIRFEASAPVSESRTSNYEGFNIVHLPTSLWAYRNTNGRHFGITGRLVSRNKNEATANAGYLTTVRSWILSDFGNSGAPPPIVFLTAYGNKQINKVPGIITSYNWTFPDDVDYIYSSEEPMPVIGMLTIELEEVYSAEQITAGAWKIKSQSGGSFSTIGVPGTASTGGPGAVESLPDSSDFIGIFGAGLGNSQTLGGTLSSNQISPVQSSSNSPLLLANSQDSKILNNRFISGSNIQTVLNNSNSSISSQASSITSTQDPFGRQIDLPIPDFNV